jgi:hypothetical protein
MTNTILLVNSTLLSILWIVIAIALGIVSYMLKTTSELDENENIKDNSIHQNIQSINRMGYKPEEDDELDGFHNAEKPHIQQGSYINEHMKSVIDKTQYRNHFVKTLKI